MEVSLIPCVDLINSYHELNPQHSIDELTEEPSALEFMRYVAKNKPFVVRGAANDWAASRRWNVDYLKKAMDGLHVQVAITEKG